jgi:hypothetical protein
MTQFILCWDVATKYILSYSNKFGFVNCKDSVSVSMQSVVISL